jgi:hypothetical protein
VRSVGLRGERLRGAFVFVQQPAEPVATAEVIELQRLWTRRSFIDPR